MKDKTGFRVTGGQSDDASLNDVQLEKVVDGDGSDPEQTYTCRCHQCGNWTAGPESREGILNCANAHKAKFGHDAIQFYPPL